MYEALGDEAAERIIGKVLVIMGTITEGYQGFVIKTIGDEIMRRFTTANDCVRAAIECQEEISAAIQGEEIDVSIKVGLHFGPAILMEDGDAFGYAVNDSAIMAGIAKGEQIITTQDTINLLDADLQDMNRQFDKTNVKGKEDEIVVHQVMMSHVLKFQLMREKKQKPHGYRLNEGQYFSDDFGNTPILDTIPDHALSVLVAATAGIFVSNTALSADFSDPFVVIDAVAFGNNLSGASIAVASAGETSASASSRSTAAAQQDEEEVTEVAFQNLKNYDDNPQGILLPKDQSFAYDDLGNIYFNVTMSKNGFYGRKESFTLYRVDLDLNSSEYNYVDENEMQGEMVMTENFWKHADYKPSLTKLSASKLNSDAEGTNATVGIESGGGEE